MKSVFKFKVSDEAGEVSAILVLPIGAEWLYVFGHGAGAGMRNRAMEDIARSLAEVGIATFRYNFPYMERSELGQKQKGALYAKPELLATVRAAVCEAAKHAPGIPLLAGGKSMGGRMTSMAAAESPLPGVRGLLFYGFPLHPSGKPGVERAEHLKSVTVPMLFLQGTNDGLATPALLRPICLGLELASLHEIEGADHSFHVPKSIARTDASVMEELAATTRKWLANTVVGRNRMQKV